MTRKNFALLALLALTATLAFPMTALAVTGDTDNTVPLTATTTIQLEQPVKQTNPNIAKLNALQQQKENATTDEERARYQSVQDAIINSKKATHSQFSATQVNMGNAKTDILTDSILAQRELNQFIAATDNFVPFTSIGYYPNDDALKVGINEDHVTAENMEKYSKRIRAIIGNDIDLIVFNGGAEGTLDTCTSRTSNCTPMEGGIQINVQAIGNCTLGFPATRNGNDGFVTAGHCLDGETGEDVRQASTRVIGTVDKETFDDGSSWESCDCGFVELDGSVSLSEEIYGVSASYYPDATGYASVNDYVKMAGKTSGIEIGQVDATNVTVTLDGTTFKYMVQADYTSVGGDSGGIMMDAYTAGPDYLGSNTGHDANGAYYVTYQKFEVYIGGLTWGL